MFGFKKVAMPTPSEALPGRASPIRTATEHFVNHRAAEGALSGRHREGAVRPRLLLGRRAQILGIG